MGKRFFKLREVYAVNVVASTGFGTYYTSLPDLPSLSEDFTNIANLFDEYRCCAMKVKYIPNVIINSLTTTAVPFIFNPIWILHDVNTIDSAITNIDTALNYESCRAYSVLRPWKYYRKMQRNIPITDASTRTTVSTRGYIPTDGAVATQCLRIGWASNGTFAANSTLGNYVVTWYVVARART
jgi:hypothetical protein